MSSADGTKSRKFDGELANLNQSDEMRIRTEKPGGEMPASASYGRAWQCGQTQIRLSEKLDANDVNKLLRYFDFPNEQDRQLESPAIRFNDLWNWLTNRREKLDKLPQALLFIGRLDLVADHIEKHACPQLIPERIRPVFLTSGLIVATIVAITAIKYFQKQPPAILVEDQAYEHFMIEWEKARCADDGESFMNQYDGKKVQFTGKVVFRDKNPTGGMQKSVRIRPVNPDDLLRRRLPEALASSKCRPKEKEEDMLYTPSKESKYKYLSPDRGYDDRVIIIVLIPKANEDEIFESATENNTVTVTGMLKLPKFDVYSEQAQINNGRVVSVKLDN